MQARPEGTRLAVRVVAHCLPAVRAKRATPSAVQLMRNAGIEPDAWQIEVLTSPSTRMLLNASRQSGKSTTLAALGLHAALAKPHALVLCVCPAQRQAQELYRKMVDIFGHTPGLPEIDKLSELRLEFATKSRVVIVPADERRGVRGFSRPDVVIFDEAAGIPDEVFAAARPLFAVHHHGKFVLASTPRGQRGTYFQEWTQGAGWQRWEIPASACPRISPEFLEQERAALGAMWFRQEFCCEFLQPDAALFDYASIDAAADANLMPLFQTPYMGGQTPAAEATNGHQFYRLG